MYESRDFFNAGNLISITGSAVREQLADAIRHARASAGLGLGVASPFGRVEVSCAYPLRREPQDSPERLQLGLGFEFL